MIELFPMSIEEILAELKGEVSIAPSVEQLLAEPATVELVTSTGGELRLNAGPGEVILGFRGLGGRVLAFLVRDDSPGERWDRDPAREGFRPVARLRLIGAACSPTWSTF